MSNIKKIFSFLAAIALVFAMSVSDATVARTIEDNENRSAQARVREPLNLAILIQDDLVSRVGTELNVTREFIRSLPSGSRVMVAYIRTGSLQVRQPFTDNLEQAASSLRIPTGSTSASSFSPYDQVVDALEHFETDSRNSNALLLISDGLDISRGFDISSNAQSLDLFRAIRQARERDVRVYSFYAPSAGLTSWNRTAISFGQSSLNRLARETGGRAFFQGTSYVTFDSYFRNLRRTLNETNGRLALR
jgi:hypothetical protein